MAHDTHAEDDLFRFREPGDDDDIDEEHVELLPIGVILRQLELDERERRLMRSESVARLERQITDAVDKRRREDFRAAVTGRGRTDRALAAMIFERLHGGSTREWVEPAKPGDRGEWRTRLNKQCRHKECRACGRTRP